MLGQDQCLQVGTVDSFWDAELTSKSHVKYLVQLLLAEALLAQHQVEGKEEHEQPVAYVSKHDRKQEGEGDDGEHRGVDLPVAGDTIGMHNLLE